MLHRALDSAGCYQHSDEPSCCMKGSETI